MISLGGNTEGVQSVGSLSVLSMPIALDGHLQREGKDLTRSRDAHCYCLETPRPKHHPHPRPDDEEENKGVWPAFCALYAEGHESTDPRTFHHRSCAP